MDPTYKRTTGNPSAQAKVALRRLFERVRALNPSTAQIIAASAKDVEATTNWRFMQRISRRPSL